MRHISVDVVVRICPTLNTQEYTLFYKKVNPLLPRNRRTTAKKTLQCVFFALQLKNGAPPLPLIRH